MPDSPRIRRLRSDARSMQQLRAESSILDYTAVGDPADKYVVRFLGRGLWRPDNGPDVVVRERHEAVISLGASYPRMMPELQWRTPIFHPNISGSGVVCLGGYGTYWVPSLSLDELCVMLWDMIRYQNYDVESPYNREAALWAKSQKIFYLPVDDRPIRDRKTMVEPEPEVVPTAIPDSAFSKPPVVTAPPDLGDDELIFIDDTSSAVGANAGIPVASIRPRHEWDVVDAEVVDAEVVDGDDPDILFIE